jgi:hypothetical protein
MHTVPALDHWPPVPLATRRPVRRRRVVAVSAEFTAGTSLCRASGCGPTVSEALASARSSLPAARGWRLARFFPADA